MKHSIKHLGEFTAHLNDASSVHGAPFTNPGKRRGRLAILAGGAALGGVAAFVTAPAVATAIGAAALAKGGLIGGAGKLGAAVLGSKLTASALGSYKGLRLAKSYLGDLQHFEFVPATNLVSTKGNAHQYVFINGFLSQDEQEFGDWHQAINDLKSFHRPFSAPQPHLPFTDLHQANGWHLRWDAKHLRELQLSFAGNSMQSLFTKSWRQAPVHVLTGLADNAWHHAYTNARKAGILLADTLWSTPEQQRFTLVGHSLGGRVVFHALQRLHELQQESGSEPRVRHVVLLGAAQGRRHRYQWQNVCAACSGHVFNCYSKQDQVLRWLYQSANLGMSRPAGRGEVPPPAVNIDCSAWVDGHRQWKQSLATIFKQEMVPTMGYS